MKKSIKFLAVLMALIAVCLAFASCDSSSSDDSTTPTTPTTPKVSVTFDWATYGVDASSFEIYADAERTKLITGTNYTMEVSAGTKLSDICWYADDLGEFNPTSLDLQWVDTSDTVIDNSTTITKDMTIYLKDGVGCVAEGCLITMGGGSKKAVEDIVLGDEVLTWDFYSGSLVSKKVISIDKTPSIKRPEITIKTDGGTIINIVDVQAFFDTDAKQYFTISNVNYKRQIGKNIMVCNDGVTIKAEKIVSIELHEEILELYDIITEDSLNFISDNALTIVPLLFVKNPYKINDDYKYDGTSMASDRAKYGLSKYEDFSMYASKDAFEKLRLEEVQILLGKGLITQDYLQYCINKFLKSTSGIR